jgi:hypothetical protein
MSRPGKLLLLAALAACAKPAAVPASLPSDPPVDAETFLAGSTLSYVSDYFSFAGEDAQGRVTFSIDNNRGQDGAAFQAENYYAVLYDEHAGWAKLEGTGRYPNPGRELLTIPDSPAFQFEGAPKTGTIVESPVNELRLEVGPIVERAALYRGKVIFIMGTAPATLSFRGRVIEGSVIYEGLAQRNGNMMTSASFEGLSSATWIYLRTADGDDLYLQDLQDGDFAKLLGRYLGFLAAGERNDLLRDIDVRVTDHALAAGLYRWQTAWEISCTGARGPATLRLEVIDRKKIGNWLLAGFSMAALEGELTYDGRTIPVFGLAELLAY